MMFATSENKITALVAASQASEAIAALLRFAREGADHPAPFGQIEVAELLADALKMTLELHPELDSEQGQMLAALTCFLEGWAG